MVNVSSVVRKDTLEQHVNVHHISNRHQINRQLCKPGVKNKNKKQHNTNKLESGAVYDLFHVNPIRCIPPLITEVLLNNKSCVMEIDTGASVSLISEGQYNKRFDQRKPQINKTNDILRTYSGENLRIIDTIHVLYKSQTVENFPLLVVPDDDPNLLGRNWLMKLKIGWKSLNLKKKTVI